MYPSICFVWKRLRLCHVGRCGPFPSGRYLALRLRAGRASGIVKCEMILFNNLSKQLRVFWVCLFFSGGVLFVTTSGTLITYKCGPIKNFWQILGHHVCAGRDKERIFSVLPTKFLFSDRLWVMYRFYAGRDFSWNENKWERSINQSIPLQPKEFFCLCTHNYFFVRAILL